MVHVLYEGGFSWYIKDDLDMIIADMSEYINNDEAGYLIEKILHGSVCDELTDMQIKRFMYLRANMKKKIEDVMKNELDIDNDAEIVIMESYKSHKPLITMKISGKTIKDILIVFNKGIKSIVRPDHINNELIRKGKSMNSIIYSHIGRFNHIYDRLKFIQDYECGKGIRLWELRGDCCLYKRIEYDGKYVRIVC